MSSTTIKIDDDLNVEANNAVSSVLVQALGNVSSANSKLGSFNNKVDSTNISNCISYINNVSTFLNNAQVRITTTDAELLSILKKYDMVADESSVAYFGLSYKLGTHIEYVDGKECTIINIYGYDSLEEFVQIVCNELDLKQTSNYTGKDGKNKFRSGQCLNYCAAYAMMMLGLDSKIKFECDNTFISSFENVLKSEDQYSLSLTDTALLYKNGLYTFNEESDGTYHSFADKANKEYYNPVVNLNKNSKTKDTIAGTTISFLEVNQHLQSTLDTVCDDIDAGYPSVMKFSNSSGNHYFVAVGYSVDEIGNKDIVFMDPRTGERTISTSKAQNDGSLTVYPTGNSNPASDPYSTCGKTTTTSTLLRYCTEDENGNRVGAAIDMDSYTDGKFSVKQRNGKTRTYKIADHASVSTYEPIEQSYYQNQ